jgi:hypothetical protein
MFGRFGFVFVIAIARWLWLNKQGDGRVEDLHSI